MCLPFARAQNRMTARFVKEPGLRPHSGAVYVVAGSGGKLSARGPAAPALHGGIPAATPAPAAAHANSRRSAPPQGPRGFLKAWGGVQYPPEKAHPASCLSRVELGSLVIDIEGDVLSAAFVNADGHRTDRWVIDKRGAWAAAAPADDDAAEGGSAAGETPQPEGAGRSAEAPYGWGGAQAALQGDDGAAAPSESASGVDGRAADGDGALGGASGAGDVGGRREEGGSSSSSDDPGEGERGAAAQEGGPESSDDSAWSSGPDAVLGAGEGQGAAPSPGRPPAGAVRGGEERQKPPSSAGTDDREQPIPSGPVAALSPQEEEEEEAAAPPG